MKTYLRILSFSRPFGKFAFPYFIFSLLSIVFGLINFTLLIPVLKVLFGTLGSEAEMQQMAQKPDFSFSMSYASDIFNYYFVKQIEIYGRMGALKFVCVILVASVLLSNIFKYLSTAITESLRAYTVKNIRRTVFDKITSMHLGYFTNERKGDIMARITTDVQEVENSVANTLSVIFREPATIIGYFLVLFGLSFKLTLFTLIVIPASGLIIGGITKRLKKVATQGQEALGNLITIIDETLVGMRVIKAFNGTNYIKGKFAKENERYSDLIRAMALRRETASPLSEFMGVSVVTGILIYGGSLVLDKSSNLDPSAFVAYIAIFSQVMRPAKAISSAFTNIQRGLASGERIFKILDEKTDVTEKPNKKQLPAFAHEIEFKQVSFAYGNNRVLNNINLKLKKGQTMALVGPSGGGKSTVADLVPRFYDPIEGQILIDGIDLRDYDMESVRAQMGIVTQESILFNDTIFNNIAFCKTDATEEEVIRAAKIANAHQFITQTENGYQTIIGDRGVKLSGGQRQRLSIARAVLKNPAILILDEATSALDTESERLVQEALTNLMQNRTSLVIAHRLSTIQHADEIVVLQQGQIVEQGRHLDLIESTEGVYKRLNMLQGMA